MDISEISAQRYHDEQEEIRYERDILRDRVAFLEKTPEPCTWTEDEDGCWFACDAPEGGKNAFAFEDGGPDYNGFKFCPYCGHPLKEVPQARVGGG